MDFQEAYLDTCSTVSRAARCGNIDILKKLIQRGKPVDIKDNRGWQSLHEAAYQGHHNCISIILEQGADVDSRTFEEQTALMLACKGGHSKCVACLLRTGADPNSATLEAYTPLWEASVRKSIECVKLLLRAGAHINSKNFTEDTALHGSMQEEGVDIDIVRCLVESGADISIQNECGLTPLFISAQFGMTECLEYFIQHASSKGEQFKKDIVNKTAEDEATALFLAAQNEHVECVRLLLNNGADANMGIADPEKRSQLPVLPLHMALFKDNRKCVEMLLKATNLKQFTWENNNYDRHTHYNYNPICIAASLDGVECLQILLNIKLFQRLFSGNDNMKFLAQRNLFSFDTKLRPAIFLTKQYKTFLEKCFRLNVCVLHECIYSILENGMDYFPVFLLMLRLGATVNIPRYWLDHVGLASAALPYWCAMMKYTRRNCHKCRDRPGNDLMCCLTTNTIFTAYGSPIQRLSIRQLQLYLTTQAHSDGREQILRKKMGDKYTVVIQESELNNLQNMCRRTIILQLIGTRGYTRKAVRELQVPKLIQSYLLFDDESTFSEVVSTAFERLQKEEIDLDKLMENVCAE